MVLDAQNYYFFAICHNFFINNMKKMTIFASSNIIKTINSYGTEWNTGIFKPGNR